MEQQLNSEGQMSQRNALLQGEHAKTIFRYLASYAHVAASLPKITTVWKMSEDAATCFRSLFELCLNSLGH